MSTPRKIIAFIIALLSIVLGWQCIHFLQQQTKNEQQVVQHTQEVMHQATVVIEKRLAELMQITEGLADQLSKNELDSTQVMQVLEKTMHANEDVFGFGVGYEPYQSMTSAKLFAPFFIRPEGEVKVEFIEKAYDYTTRDWYTIPLNNGKAWFEPPYYGEIAQTMMAEYSVPIYRIDSTGHKKAIGLVYLDYSLSDITESVNNLELGKSGYGFMMSEKGVIVAHPISDNILAQKTLDQFCLEWKNFDIKTLFSYLTFEDEPFLELVNPENNEWNRLFFTEVPNSGWRLGAVFVEEVFKTDAQVVNQFLLRIVTTCILLILMITLLYLEKRSFKLAYVIKSTPVLSVAFGLGLLCMWLFKQAEYYNIYQQENSFPLTEKTALEMLLAEQDSTLSFYHQPKTIKIPTGVFVKHIDFHKAHEVKVSGVVWQRIPKIKDSLIAKPGIFFLDAAPDAEAVNIKPIYTRSYENESVHGFYFQIALRQNMDYLLYPFDQENIRLSVQHPDYDANVQLIPDFSSYKNTIATQLPGVDEHLVLPEWKPIYSYFDFRKERFNTSFGVHPMLKESSHFSFGYNIVLKRNFLWPFMSNFIPLSTITILLFIALISIIRNGAERTGILFNGFGVVELCSAFLFVAILTHIDLRSSILVNYTIYMDYFYFHIYFIIIASSIASVIFNKSESKAQLKYCIWLYWPVLTASLYFFSLFLFYRN